MVYVIPIDERQDFRFFIILVQSLLTIVKLIHDESCCCHRVFVTVSEMRMTREMKGRKNTGSQKHKEMEKEDLERGLSFEGGRLMTTKMHQSPKREKETELEGTKRLESARGEPFFKSRAG